MAGAKSLVIVESPTKAKTIKKMLGSSFKVVSSMGHIIDLPRSKLGIDLDNGYSPEYKIIKGKEKITKELKSEAKSAETIYLATDPDREGEAISWHIREMLLGNISSQTKKARAKAGSEKPTRKKKVEQPKTFKRVVFHEITKHAIKEAFDHPLELDDHKVDAQQARRVLDRIVGYFLSPFLWKKVCRGLSAGRVQSIALKFIVDREKEIRAFVPQTFYYVDMVFEKDGQRFTARLNKHNGEKIEFTDRNDAERAAELLRQKAFTVSSKKTTINFKKPNPPFITSSLQQEAFRKLGFSSSRTMLVAQRLYEGVEISDEGAVGLITYMRTDSFNISADAKTAVKQYIGERFGVDYCAAKEYAFKKKGIVQAAHEAIRPTDVRREPDAMGRFLASDEQSLYGLIWKRFVSSFMSEAQVERTRLVFTVDGYEASANGSRVVFDGYLKVYPDKVSEELLPLVNEQEILRPVEITVTEKTTQPPARFNDASLVKVLEEKGIGRPSTYAPTISTLIKRDYINREGGSFRPTELGFVVTDLLETYFRLVMDEGFTAHMENSLDHVENGDLDWRKVIDDFFPQFRSHMEEAESKAEKEYVSAGRTCDKCGREMIIRYSRRGRFISCSGYPECTNAYPLTTDVVCPECKEGKLVERRNRKGQKFYGCSRFPECRYTSSNLPQDDNR